MTRSHSLRLLFCLALLALPALALGGPSGQSGAAAPQNSDCVYLPMVGAGGQAAANISVAQAANPCDGLAAAPEPSPTDGGTETATATNTSTSTATATDTATSTATATDTSTVTATATGTLTATHTATATSTPTDTATSTATHTATSTGTATSTSTATPSQTPTESGAYVGGFSGEVQIWPEYESHPEPDGWALQIVVVLDVSGSMNANFQGQCNNIGRILQCSNGPQGYPAVQASGAGGFYFWNTQEERRIYVAKKSVQRLLDLLNLSGSRNYNAGALRDDIAIVPFAEQQRASEIFGWSSDFNGLKNAVQNAGAYNNNAYRTSGGTNGAAGLYRAAQLLKERPSSTMFNGKRYNYKRVILFVSDGVASQFFDPNDLDFDGGPSDASTYSEESPCALAEGNESEIVLCQTTEGVGQFNGLDRPITQMINTARAIQIDPAVNAEIYTLAQSHIPATGLRDGVSSFPSYYYPVPMLTTFPDGKTNVDLILESIWGEPVFSTCEPQADGEWRSTFPPESVGNVSGLTYPVIGEASIVGPGDTQLTADIRVDASGHARYSFTGLPPGSYALSTYVFYRHPLDPPSIMARRYSLIEYGGDTYSTIPVVVAPDGVTMGPNVRLKLFGNTCAGD
jgi:hypothetical protein